MNVSASEVITPITNEIRTVSLENTSAEFQAVLAESGAIISDGIILKRSEISSPDAFYVYREDSIFAFFMPNQAAFFGLTKGVQTGII